MPPELSVIVPVLDEAAHLPSLIRSLRQQSGVRLDIILGDGGSRDASVTIAEHLGATVVQTPAGRGRQMNAAAALSRAPHLLFLHADSRLTRPDQLARALQTLRRSDPPYSNRVAGHFSLQFAREHHKHGWLYRYMEAKSALNCAGTFNGDQGLLVSKAFFHALGGFDERLPFLEDQRLAARLRQDGRFVTLPDPLVTSARRFEKEGLYRRYLLMALIMGCEATGLHEFFIRAPGAYRAQSQATRLRIGPFIELIAQCLYERRAADRRRIWADAGRYARDNAWQLFYLLDVLSGHAPDSAPCLNAFDHRIRSYLARPWADTSLSLLVRVWVMLALRAYFRVTGH